MNSTKWTLIAVALVVNQLGGWLTGQGFGVWTEIAVLVLVGGMYLLVCKNPYTTKAASMAFRTQPSNALSG